MDRSIGRRPAFRRPPAPCREDILVQERETRPVAALEAPGDAALAPRLALVALVSGFSGRILLDKRTMSSRRRTFSAANTAFEAARADPLRRLGRHGLGAGVCEWISTAAARIAGPGIRGQCGSSRSPASADLPLTPHSCIWSSQATMTKRISF